MKKDIINYIYTPISLWSDFVINCSFNESFISELVNDGIVYKNLYFSAGGSDNERVRVFATYACPKNDNGSIVVLVGDPSQSINLETIKLFVKMGFGVLMPDLKGECEADNFTKYPSAISYANYSVAKNSLFTVEQTVKQTAWYEWASVVRYCLAFCKSNFKAKRLGLVGIKNGSNVCYMSCTNEVDCFVSLFGAGWQMFKDEDKFIEAYNLTDEQRKFIAGIEAESYAPYIKCPVLFLTPTNNAQFHFERSVDTLARLSEEAYLDFTPRMQNYLDFNSLNQCKLFLEKYLNLAGIALYSSPEIALNVKDKTIVVNVKYDSLDKIESCSLYYSNASVDVFKRNWNLCSDEICESYIINDKTLNEYISVFVRVKYDNGVSVCSPVVVKKINERAKKRINPLFSGKKSENSFTCRMPSTVVAGLFYDEKEVGVEIVKGPFGINGAYCESGLVNYKIGEISSLLTSSDMVKFDIFSEKFNDFTVAILVDEGEVKEYKVNSSIKGAKIWQNFCENLSEFKDDTGRTIKDFSKIFAITFYSEEEFLISNLLVV